MNESSNTKVASETVRGTYGTLGPSFDEPESIRLLVEKSVSQTHELYERSKDAFDAVIESWQESFTAAGQGAVALNRKVLDLTRRNIGSSFELATKLSSAKTLAEVMELQTTHWRKQLDAIAGQAEEVRTLTAQVAADAAAPFAKGLQDRGDKLD
jgi:hypothetical protein